MRAELTIGEVAQRAGVRTSAIRYYERVGLLPSPARAGGRRRYDDDVLTLLAGIEFAKSAGFSLEEIRRLFDGGGGSARWRALAERKLVELDAQAQRIEDMRAVLERGLECDCLSLEDCRLVRVSG